MGYPFPNQNLASRIETALAIQQRRFMEFLQADPSPAVRVDLLPIDDHAIAVFAGAGHYFTRVTGLGAAAPVTAEQLDRVEKFYADRGDACRLELCPLADPSLLALTRERRYTITQFTNVYFREPPAPGEDLALPAGIAVEHIPAEDAQRSEELVDVIHRAFAGPNATRDDMWRMAHRSTSRPGVARFGAFVPDVPAPIAGGVLDMVTSGDGRTVALLAGTGTHEAYRARGAQSAIIRARLAGVRDAIRNGLECDLVVIQTRPGIASERNIIRHGFRLAYTRPQVVRAL